VVEVEWQEGKAAVELPAVDQEAVAAVENWEAVAMVVVAGVDSVGKMGKEVERAVLGAMAAVADSGRGGRAW
jgi:hypothetical protein